MENKELTKEELNELVGGVEYLQSNAIDVLNHNTVWNCKCTYNNRNVIENKNDYSGGCTCECWPN
jgi:hypothetical protein